MNMAEDFFLRGDFDGFSSNVFYNIRATKIMLEEKEQARKKDPKFYLSSLKTLISARLNLIHNSDKSIEKKKFILREIDKRIKDLKNDFDKNFPNMIGWFRFKETIMTQNIEKNFSEVKIKEEIILNDKNNFK